VLLTICVENASELQIVGDFEDFRLLPQFI
jgi:hypothetical protein